MILRQATAVDVLIGPFVDSTDGDTEETALTIAQADVRLSKNGQTAAQKADVTTAAHDADGFYNCELDATDTDTVGTLVLYVHVAGALAVRHDFQVVEEAVYDALYAASATGVPALAALEATAQSILTDTGTTLQAELDAIQAAVITNAAGADIAADIIALKAETAAILLDTAEIGAAGAGLTAINLPNQAMDITGNITGNLSGSVGSLAAQAKADVNAEVVDALNTDTYAEPGQGAPPATTSLVNKIGYPYKAWRNRKTNDGAETTLYADDGTTPDQQQATTEAAGTVEKGKWGTGA